MVVSAGLGAVSRVAHQRLTDRGEIQAALERTGFVDHLYDSVLPASIERATAHGLPLGSASDAPRLAVAETDRALFGEAVEIVAPRSWAEQRVHAAIHEVGRFVVGGVPDLEFESGLGRRAARLSDVAEPLAERMDVAERLHEVLVGPAFESGASPLLSGALGVSVSPGRLERAAAEIAPPAWIEAQLVYVVAASEPFLAGEVDSFSARVRLEPVVRQAASVLQKELRKGDTARELILDRIVDPTIEAYVARAEWPNQTRLDADALREAVRRSITETWALDKADHVLRRLEAYLVGERSQLTVEVSVVERKDALATTLAESVQAELSRRLNDLPTCGWLETAEATRELKNEGWPTCRPLGADAWLALAQPEIERRTREHVEALPDELVLTEPDLRELLGEPAMDSLRDLRDEVAEGVRFDERDLGWQSESRGADNPDWLMWARGAPMGQRVISAFPELTTARRFVEREWLWWSLSFGALFCFGWTRPGGTRARAASMARLILAGGAILSISAIGLGTVSWIHTPEPGGTPLIRALLTEPFVERMDQEIARAWHAVAMWAGLAAAAGGVGALALRRHRRPGRGSSSRLPRFSRRRRARYGETPTLRTRRRCRVTCAS